MYNGIINIYKEKNYTSHDVVAIVRKMLCSKAGHTGTLDPMAEGVLPICVGKATKIAEYIASDIKGYRVIVQLGVVTDTEDASGRVLKTNLVDFNKEQINSAVVSFKGEYMQTPPMYSAIKVNGQRLYNLARQGKVVERKKRLINIYEINILEYLDNNMLEMEVLCSKGTYIRTLCADIGQKLGFGANMYSLLRIRSGKFYLKDSIKLGELETVLKAEKANKYIIKPWDYFSSYECLMVMPAAANLLYNGNKIPFCFINDKEKLNFGQKITFEGNKFLLLDENSKFIGLYSAIWQDKMLKPVIMF